MGRGVAAIADTSVEMIERTYSAHIGHYADEIARRGLLAPTSAAVQTHKLGHAIKQLDRPEAPSQGAGPFRNAHLGRER